MKIKVSYRSVDRFSQTRQFATLDGARKFAQRYVGETPDMGSYYAVSDDGIGRITVSGDATLADLFPKTVVAVSEESDEANAARMDHERDLAMHAQEVAEQQAQKEAEQQIKPYARYRFNSCICSDEQLATVGCDCDARLPF